MSRSAVLAKAAAAARDLADALAELAHEDDGDKPGDMYDSRHPPPRTTRRRFAELCRSGRVPGARREGRDWVCEREAWHAARARTGSKLAAPPARETTLVERADRLVRRSRLRFLGTDEAGRGRGGRA